MKTKEFFQRIKEICPHGCVFTGYTDFNEIEVETIKALEEGQYKKLTGKDGVEIIESKD